MLNMMVAGAKNISLDYDRAAISGQELLLSLELIDFETGVYDVKIDILADERRISKIWDDGWKSSNFYIASAINEQEKKEFRILIDDDFEGEAGVIVKIRDSRKKVSSFGIYSIEVKREAENEEKEERVEQDIEELEIMEEINHIKLEKPAGKDIKTQENTGKLEYKSKMHYVREYILYVFAFFCLVSGIIYIIRKRK